MAYKYKELDFNGIVKFKDDLAACKSTDKNAARAEAANLMTEMVTAKLGTWFNWTLDGLFTINAQAVKDLDNAIENAEQRLRHFMEAFSTNSDYMLIKIRIGYETYTISGNSYNCPSSFMVTAALTKSKGWIYFA